MDEFGQDVLKPMDWKGQLRRLQDWVDYEKQFQAAVEKEVERRVKLLIGAKSNEPTNTTNTDLSTNLRK